MPIAQSLTRSTNLELLAIADRQISDLSSMEQCPVGSRMGIVLLCGISIKDSHKAYEKLRRQVRTGVERSLKSWCADPLLLGGAAMDIDKLEEAIHDHLVSFVLDDFLSSTVASEQPARSRIEELATDFLKHHVRPLPSGT